MKNKLIIGKRKRKRKSTACTLSKFAVENKTYVHGFNRDLNFTIFFDNLLIQPK